MAMNPEHIALARKVEFLGCKDTYLCRPGCVESIETHMAWVFLTEQHAYKLKKPVKTEYLDFSTVEARRSDCQRELLLNRRLAPDVYQQVVPLAVDDRGDLVLDEAAGEIVYWLVKMGRLPRDRMLDTVMERGSVERADIERVARLLVDFYRRADPIPLTPDAYCERLAESIDEARRELSVPDFGLNTSTVDTACSALLQYVDLNPEVLGRRVEQGEVIDAHGDLRPEHICLEEQPVIIDCIEFNRALRLLDSASEMSFLTLECDRLGAPEVSRHLWETYLLHQRNPPAADLLRFYRSYHACLRAKVAIWHLKDADVRTPDHWKAKAEEYLAEAARVQEVL